MKQMPKIDKVMTPMPHTIGDDISIQVALDMMRKNSFRHLPVQHGGKLVGLLSDRDIKLAASFEGASDMTVEDVMTPDPYVVRPGTPLDEVVSQMAEHKYGCAIVEQDNGKVVGIFTATDGLRVLAEVLHGNYKSA